MQKGNGNRYVVSMTEELLELLETVAKRVGHKPNWVARRAANSLRLRPLLYSDAQRKLYNSECPERVRSLSLPGPVKKCFIFASELPEGTTPLQFRMRLAEKCIDAENCEPVQPFQTDLRAGIDYIVKYENPEDEGSEEEEG